MHECFKCGRYFLVEASTATEEFKTVYDSKECQEADQEEMEKTKLASIEGASILNPQLTELASNIKAGIGGFILKVKEKEKE